MIGRIMSVQFAVLLLFICQFLLVSCEDSEENNPSDGDMEASDGDVETVDGDISESENENTDAEGVCGTTDITCTTYSSAECEDFNWVDFCADTMCLREGWAYTCNEEGVCVDRCSVDVGDEEGTATDYAGVWGGILATPITITGLPQVTPPTVVQFHYLLIRVQASDDNVVMHSRLCSIENVNLSPGGFNREGGLMQLTVDLDYTDHAGIMEHRVTSIPALTVGATFSTSTFWEARGIKLENIENDQLPEFNTEDDPRVWDQDADGYPGMTLSWQGVIVGDLYSVQRLSSRLEGEVVDADHLKGSLDFTSELMIIGSEDSQLLYDHNTIPYENGEGNYFRLLRMGPDASCTDVLAEKEEDGFWLSPTENLDNIPVKR